MVNKVDFKRKKERLAKKWSSNPYILPWNYKTQTTKPVKKKASSS